jgi:hypothetical protein
MVTSANLGSPRIGARRELKKALEDYWAGRRETAQRLRRAAWLLQQRLGIARIPSNDFSLYDHVLDTAAMVGAVPPRHDKLPDRQLAEGSTTTSGLRVDGFATTRPHLTLAADRIHSLT